MDTARERARINNGERVRYGSVGWAGAKTRSRFDPRSEFEDGRAKERGTRREGESGATWRGAGDLCELIKYAGDLSSLHPRGHPGGTPV